MRCILLTGMAIELQQSRINMKNHTFESAQQRLEEILEALSKPNIQLEQSLSLYEEGDALVNFCSKTLSNAEKKIETLIKNRDGSIAENAHGEPLKTST